MLSPNHLDGGEAACYARIVKYLSPKFSTPANSRAFVENWDAVFGEKDEIESALYDLVEKGMPVRACKSCGREWVTQRGAGALTCLDCDVDTEFES